MKDNATLEDVLSALNKKYILSSYAWQTNHIYDSSNPFSMPIKWQLNKPFSEQSEETKETLNKIL